MNVKMNATGYKTPMSYWHQYLGESIMTYNHVVPALQSSYWMLERTSFPDCGSGMSAVFPKNVTYLQIFWGIAKEH